MADSGRCFESVRGCHRPGSGYKFIGNIVARLGNGYRYGRSAHFRYPIRRIPLGTSRLRPGSMTASLAST